MRYYNLFLAEKGRTTDPLSDGSEHGSQGNNAVSGCAIDKEPTLIITIYGDDVVYGLGCGREQFVCGLSYSTHKNRHTHTHQHD